MFDALIPFPRYLARRDGLPIPIARGLRFQDEGVPPDRVPDWRRLAALVLGERLADEGLTVHVRCDPHFQMPEWAGQPESLLREAYELRAEEGALHLTALAWEGLIRGLMTLVQVMEETEEQGFLPPFRIVDWPRLASRGLHYDLAREMEYRPAHLKAVIQRLAYFRLNTFHLYLEGTFAYPSAPEVTPPGALTPSQARELVEWARLFGVTVIPQVPTLGHMDRLLHGPYAALREDPASPFNLCPTHPRARPFLAGLLSDVADAFRPPFLHIGYDESHAGRCPRCRAVGRPEDLLADHLNWLHGQVKALGARTMIYGDKFLAPACFPRSDATNGGTPDAARRAIEKVSREVLITDWHYTAPWGGTFRFFRDQGFEVHVATATNIYWHDSIPLNRGHHWIVETIEEAIRQGVTGGFNTNWELYRGAFFDNYWFFQALAAERLWSDRPHDYPRFGARFCRRFWGLPRDEYSEIAGLMESIPTSRRGTFLDSPILADMGPDQARLDYEGLADYLDRRIGELRAAVRRNRDALAMLDMPALIIRYLGARKVGLHRARQASEQGDREAVQEALRSIRRISERVEKRLQEGYEQYGGAVEDRRRIRRHLADLDDLIASGGDLRLAQRLTDFSASPLVDVTAVGQTLARPPADLTFRPVPTIGPEEMADIRGVHQGKDGLVYVRSTLRFPCAFQGILLFGADGPVKVWINGRGVAVVPEATNPCLPDQYRAAASFREGENEVLFAIATNKGRAWGVCGRIQPAGLASAEHLESQDRI